MQSTSVGVAAHITAAAIGGPRYDPSMTPSQRASIENAIWLCQSCSRMIDRDIGLYTPHMLRDWKKQAENRAQLRLKGKTEFRAIAPSELLSRLTPGEKGLLRELEEEFGCEIKLHAQVPNDQGGGLTSTVPLSGGKILLPSKYMSTREAVSLILLSIIY